jgi:hypothetical protein
VPKKSTKVEPLSCPLPHSLQFQPERPERGGSLLTVETLLVPIAQQPGQAVVLVRFLCLWFQQSAGATPLWSLWCTLSFSQCCYNLVNVQETCKGQSGKKCRVPQPIRIIPGRNPIIVSLIIAHAIPGCYCLHTDQERCHWRRVLEVGIGQIHFFVHVYYSLSLN